MLTSGVIPKLAMRRCVLGKDTLYAYLPLELCSLPVMVAQADERLANRTKEKCSALMWLIMHKVPGSCEETNGT